MFVSERQVVLEKWKGVQAGGRTGVVGTRAESRRVPECVHTMQISRPDGTNEDPRSVSPESYRVSRGALGLEFEELFLRSANSEEADIIITDEELQQFAPVVGQNQLVAFLFILNQAFLLIFYCNFAIVSTTYA